MKQNRHFIFNTAILATTLFVVADVCAAGQKFLTLKDAAVAEAKRWQETGTAKPIMSDDGKVLFPYGQYMPTITCAPIRACDIELEPGEVVTDKPKAGDPIRWKISKGTSGAGDKKVTHVVVKPVDVNLDTNLIVYTDKRSYHIRLFSSANEKDYLNRVGFYYPEEITNEWDESTRLAEKEQKEKEKLTVAEMPATAIDKLDFGYKISGSDANIKPLRVFNDGIRVFLQMPPGMKSNELPVLVLYDKEDKVILPNWRVKDDYFIVDKLFDKATLIIGTDGTESKVTISWNKAQKSFWTW
jgi:type IV secretion system protein VirB9